MLPLDYTVGASVQAERLRALEARTATRLARAGRPDRSGAKPLATCAYTPATVAQRVAFRLGFVPANC